MKRIRSPMVMAAAALVAVVAVPAGAATVTGTTETTGYRGDLAWGVTGIDMDPGVALEYLYVQGTDAVSLVRTGPGAATRTPAPSSAFYYAYELDTETNETMFTEVGCAVVGGFQMKGRLDSASVAFTCEASVRVFEPSTGMWLARPARELAVSATWTGVGSINSSASHSRYVGDEYFTLDRAKSTSRNATAMATISDEGGVVFDGPLFEAELDRGQWANTIHYRP